MELNRQKPWRETKHWTFPYKGKTVKQMLENPEYVKDRNKLFRENGNGWWWTFGLQRRGRRKWEK